MKSAKSPPRQSALLGIGFDATDGHKRLTRGKNFVLVGGSEETHSVMQETVVKVTEQLDRRGRRLEDVTTGDLRAMFEDAR